MRRRNHCVRFWLNDTELEHLRTSVKKTGLKTDGYMRMIVQGRIPKPLPPIEYNEMIAAIVSVCNALEQIAGYAHIQGSSEAAKFDECFKEVQQRLLNIEMAFTLPDKISNGYDKDMESSQ